MEFLELDNAKKLKLMQLMKWLQNTEKNKAFLKKEQDRILLDKKRTCILVKHKGRISLFVNDVSI